MTHISQEAPAHVRDAPAHGWLVAQLPQVLAEDAFLQRFVGIFEQIATTVHGRIDGIEHHLDPDLAPPEFLRWLGGWLGLAVDASLPLERQRRLVRTAGPLLAWRGTRYALQGLLGALTDSPVDIHDGGGVFPAGRSEPADRRVTVRLEHTGAVDEHQLLEFLHRELPVDVTVELLIQERTVTMPAAEPDRPDANGDPRAP